MNLHVTDWVATQWEDLVLKAVINWIPNQKKNQGDDTNTEEGMAVLQGQKKLMLYQGALYHSHILAGELEEVLWLVVPTAHWVPAMNGCHQDAGHQGQQWTLYLLQDLFWWPSTSHTDTESNQQLWTMHPTWRHLCQSTNAAHHCYPSFGAATHKLYEHWDDYEMTMKQDQPLNMVSILVFCNHFTKHIMAYVTPQPNCKDHC